MKWTTPQQKAEKSNPTLTFVGPHILTRYCNKKGHKDTYPNPDQNIYLFIIIFCTILSDELKEKGLIEAAPTYRILIVYDLRAIFRFSLPQ